MCRRIVSLGISVLVASTGCGDSGVITSVDGTGPADVLADASEPVDIGTPDTFSSDTTEPDIAGEDIGARSTCEPGEGCFGESCTSADDCLSGICTMHLGDKVCSKTCDEACPAGWDCTLVGSGGDGQYVCMSKFSHLCLPCEGSDGCTGETPNACVKYGDGTSFCGGACDLETPCPSGYACQEVETSTGAKSYQCINTAGVCPCSNLAIDSALATACEFSNDLGSCSGLRVCEESGLSECSAAQPTAESCNGIDDDCNGLTDENTCDDGNACTVDTCAGEGGCQHEPLDEGECLDGDACTIGDHCEAGVCVGQAIDCDDGNPCTESSCDGLGGCQHASVVAVCDDGDACTLGDICQDGVCQGSASLTCDDGNPCTDDSCGDAGCVFEPNTVPCDDGNACTSGDSCQGGACVSEQITCDDGNLCTTDSCDFASGCVNTNNTQPCDDGDGCTQGDVCASGACSSGTATVCDDGNPCTDDACDGELGCVFAPNDIECDDKNTCTTLDSCVEGNCIGLGDLGCDDGNPCTEDACLPGGGCSHSNVVGLCSDGDACTGNDTCVEGSCVSGEPISCDDGNPCTDESCDGGDCVFTKNTSECDDGNACTEASTCQNGMCVGKVGTECDDGNPCTDDACDPAVGCTYQNNAALCNDGNLCTTTDVCSGGTCTGSGNLSCNDGNPCTDDACEADSGCVHTANLAPCEDGDLCTVNDTCADGGCNAGVDELVCDDGLYCNGVESCDPAVGCVLGTPPNLDDGVACTDDSCDEESDTIVHSANDNACDNGVFCDGTEVCDVSQGCLAGEPVTVDDGVPCTDDSCDEVNDTVVNAPNDGFCASGGLCITDTCDPGAGCQSSATPNCCGNNIVEPGETCDDGNQNNGDGCSSDCSSQTVEYGPVHTFNGHQAQFYIGYGQGSCSVGSLAGDAEYFCTHFYNASCSPKPGYYQTSTNANQEWVMHKNGGCTSKGEDIPGKQCQGGPCKIGMWSEGLQGLKGLVCVCNP